MMVEMQDKQLSPEDITAAIRAAIMIPEMAAGKVSRISVGKTIWESALPEAMTAC